MRLLNADAPLKDRNMDDRYPRHRPAKLDEQTDKVAREAIQEARMVTPGIQALFGFQLIAVFNERFKELTEDERLIHFSATILVTIAIALIMTPAAYHRLAEQTTISKFFVWLASWLIAAAMVPLMLGLTLEVYLLGLLVIGDPKTSLAVSTALFGIFS
ncbi:MAG: DUF6328 family protein, partial [Methylocella sp.]